MTFIKKFYRIFVLGNYSKLEKSNVSFASNLHEENSLCLCVK